MDDLDLIETLWAIPTPDAAIVAEVRHEAPALTGLQRQGDLLLIPFDDLPPDGHARLKDLPLLVPVYLDPDHPLTVLDGAHAHRLRGRRPASWAPIVGTADRTRGMLGVLIVPPPVTVWLEHTGHHSPLAIAEGRYLFQRQRAYLPTPTAPPRASTGRRTDPGRHTAPPRRAGRVAGPWESPGSRRGRDGAPVWRTVID